LPAERLRETISQRKTSPKLRRKRAGSSVENGGEKFKYLSAYIIRTGISSAKTGGSATPGRHHGNENPQGKPEGKGKITPKVLTRSPICKGTPFRLAHLLAVIPCPSRPRPVFGLFAVCYSGVASQLPRRLFSWKRAKRGVQARRLHRHSSTPLTSSTEQQHLPAAPLALPRHRPAVRKRAAVVTVGVEQIKALHSLLLRTA
jgi:hypothetical protein